MRFPHFWVGLHSLQAGSDGGCVGLGNKLDPGYQNVLPLSAFLIQLVRSQTQSKNSEVSQMHLLLLPAGVQI